MKNMRNYLLLFLLLIPNTACFHDVYTVARIVDGYTIVVSVHNKYETVRLIGVDSTAAEHHNMHVDIFAEEAFNFTKSVVEGKRVMLQYDVQKRDRYNKILAYVYLEDGTFLNAEIIKQGYAYADTRFPFKYYDEFLRHEIDAKKNNRGSWG